MTSAQSTDVPRAASTSADVTALIPLVRRVVGSRVADAATAEDLVQETLARLLAAVDRVAPDMLEPYAIVTARNVVITGWKEQDRQRRNQHRVVDLRPVDAPEDGVLAREEQAALARALTRLSEPDRRTLIAHEVAGQDTRSLAAQAGSTPGAVAARLNRIRARLRVEYLLALERSDPPTERCRPVLLALSGGDRRRQRELSTAHHLLECDLCARLSGPLLERGQSPDDRIRIPVRVDADVVAARQAARELAARLAFSATELTVIATAVSEVARNIVRFAGSGEILIDVVSEPRPGVCVVARDAGPGIPDVDQALGDGFSTYNGLGLGLPGARRLMDEFEVDSEVGCGTTVTMRKWRQED